MTVWSVIRRASLAAVLVGMAGCTTVYRNHGYAPSAEDLEAITIGVDTRATVEETVGVPSTLGVTRDSSWFYVGSRWRHYAYRAPEEIDRQLVAIRFDSAGVVQNVERFTLADGQVVPLARRVTDSPVKDTTFLRQLLGNIGRFDAGALLNR